MAIRLITKTTGRILAKTHCNMFYMGKGNNLYGGPYGIVPTEDDDPLGLVFSESALTVSIKPGQLYCYGRQCIIDEETQILDMHDWKRTDKCYGVVYLQIDLSDIVEQFCRFDLAYGTENYPDFNQSMNRSNLYKRGNGIYDVPIARFIYSPDGEGGKYFTKYEKVIPLLDEQARAGATSIEKIGGTKIESAFDDSLSLIKANNADHSEAAHTFGNVTIDQHLDKVWTGKRERLFTTYSDLVLSTTEKEAPVKIDFKHLMGAYVTCLHLVSSNPRRDVYLRFPADYLKSHVKEFSLDLLIKFSFDIELKKGITYSLGVPVPRTIDIRTFGTADNKKAFFTIQVYEGTIESDKVIPLAQMKMDDNGIKWNGLYSSPMTIYWNDMQWGFKLATPSMVTSTESGEWFYGNQGKYVYADFIYRDDVNVS